MRAEHFRVATIALEASAIFIFTYLVALAPSRPPQRLGRRGQKRMEALVRNTSWASVEPFVRWLGVRVSNILPRGMAKTLDRHILYAGDYYGLLPEEYVALSLISTVGGGVFGYVLGELSDFRTLALAGGLALGAMVPYLQITAEGQERFLKVTRGLPYAVDLITLGMSAGLDFPGAIRQVVAKSNPDDPMTDELRYMLQQLQLGNTRRAVLLEFADRVPTEAVKEFVTTIVQAEEKGNPIVDTLVIQSTVSRQRRTTLAEEAASKAGVKMVIPLGLMLATVMVVIMAPLFMKVMAGMNQN